MHDRPGYTRAQVEWLAWELWDADGQPDDNAQHYWYMAERMLESKREPDPKLANLLAIARRH